MNHTPGPWRLSESNTIWGRNEEYIAEVNDMDDAIIIAAAPEMLKALKGVISHNNALKPGYKLSYSLIAHVQEAIAKAEGKG